MIRRNEPSRRDFAASRTGLAPDSVLATGQSPQGAAAWLDSWQEILKRIADNPELFSVAPENPDHPDEIRQATFKTRRGRRYRTLFVVRGDVVAILHVRGPGQKFIP